MIREGCAGYACFFMGYMLRVGVYTALNVR